METHAAERSSGHAGHDGPHDAAAEQRRQLALRHVRQYPDPVLRRATHDVTEFDDELRALVGRMASIMQDAWGVGLAAPQLGLLQRMFVYQIDDEEPEAVVNPVITARGDETEVEDEGCLSLGEVRLPASRATAVTVTGNDADGNSRTWELTGFAARVFQHEIDHLDGMLLLDRTDDAEARREALRDLRPRPG